MTGFAHDLAKCTSRSWLWEGQEVFKGNMMWFFFTTIWSHRLTFFLSVLCLKSFKQMIASCLVKDPNKRPTARKLLKHSFFKQAKSNEFIVRKLLDGLPAIGDRLQLLKVPLLSFIKINLSFIEFIYTIFILLTMSLKLVCWNIEKGRRHACAKENAGRTEGGNVTGIAYRKPVSNIFLFCGLFLE